MIGAARQSVALMDASKVNGRGMYRFADWNAPVRRNLAGR